MLTRLLSPRPVPARLLHARTARTASLAAALLLVIGLGIGLPRPLLAAVFNAETFTLGNGMQVVLIPNRVAPVVTHMVWYRAGAADELPDQTGIAHFTEHLMFKGTKTVPAGEFSTIVARHGGRENAFTSYDYTAYFQTIARDRLELVMKLEADRMVNLALQDTVIIPERDVVLEERRTRTENDPAAILGEQARAAMFLVHPYGNPIIGWPDQIRRLGRPQAEAFYKAWYAPNNAILVVAGDVTMAELRPLAERIYGAIPARAVPERRRAVEPVHAAARSLTLEDARVRQPRWQRSYLAPSYARGFDGAGAEHAYALQVLAEVLGGGSTSRLYRRLVVESKLAAGAGAYYDAERLDLTEFTVYASPRPSSGPPSGAAAAVAPAGTPRSPAEDVAELARLTDGVLAELVASGVTAEEVDRAKQRMIDAAAFARDGLFPGARELGSALTTGRSVEDVERWPERIGAVTVEAVNAAARAVLHSQRSVTSQLLPKPTS